MKNELERYERTEAQNLLRLFAAARSPSPMQAPPHFRAKVLARVEQRRTSRGVVAWLTRGWSPVWAAALAVSLLLSLSINVWLGLRTAGQGEIDNRQAQSSAPENSGSDVLFDAYTFQAGITSATDLGALVTAHSVVGQQTTAFGFATRSAQGRSFIIGTLYAEALAYVRSGNLDVAVQRWEAMDRELSNVQVPRALSSYTGKMQNLLESRQYTAEVYGELLALFEPSYAAYARSSSTDNLTFFRAGTWLVNMSLAAAAGDKESLRQVDAIQYFTSEMLKLNAPKGVMDSFERISHIVAQSAMTDKDITEVLRLVKKLQTLLG